MSEIVKICKKHGVLTLNETYQIKNYKSRSCKFCRHETLKRYGNRNHKNWYENNKEKCVKKAKTWVKNNPEKRKANLSRYRQSHLESEKKRLNDINRNNTKSLSDGYIKRLICCQSRLISKDIDRGLVEVKRLQLKIKRLTKEIKNENKKC